MERLAFRLLYNCGNKPVIITRIIITSRKLGQDNQNDGCDPCGSLQALRRNKYAASMDGGFGNFARTKTTDVSSCGLSASLFGNAAALKAFERQSGMTIEE